MMGKLLGSWELQEHFDVFTFCPDRSDARYFCFESSNIPFPSPTSIEHPKRHRPLADVDGDGSVCAQKKKRRLRLVLITSRLSQPYSAPPTHIVSRGSSKIAIWAKQKALGRSSLRKAAVINRIRRRSLEEGKPAHGQICGTSALFMYDYSATVLLKEPRAEEDERPNRSPDLGLRRQHLPLPPSPLGLTNYDAIDDEDVFSDEEDGDGGSLIYSDWNVLEPAEPVTGDHDALSAFADGPFWGELLEPPEEHVDEIMEERERQKQVAFVEFGY